MKREKWYSEIGYGVYDENKYKTKFYEKAIEDEKNKETNRKVNSQNKKRKQEKMNNYAKIVKEMHWPEVSARKRQEMEEIKHQMVTSSKPKFLSPKPHKSHKQINYSSAHDDSNESIEVSKEVKKPNWNFHNPMVPKPQPKREPIEVDWLKDQRIKRQDNNESGKERMNETEAWKKLAKNQDLDDQTKMQMLKVRTRQLEENALRKEQMNKIGGHTMEGTVKVNELLINAIESKLSLLDNFM